MGAWARWRARACACVRLCVGESSGSDKNNRTAGAFSLSRSHFLQFFHMPIHLLSASPTSAAGKRLRTEVRISGSFAWRSTWFKVTIGSVQAGCPSYQSGGEKNADGPVGCQGARGNAGFFFCFFARVRERAEAAAGRRAAVLAAAL